MLRGAINLALYSKASLHMHESSQMIGSKIQQFSVKLEKNCVMAGVYYGLS